MTQPVRPILDPDSLAIATIRMEADGEPYIGKIAVGEVIRNRMSRHYSSDGTVAGTVLHVLQFSCWNTDNPRRGTICAASDTDPLSVEARRAWENAELGLVVPGAVLYHADSVKPDWAARARFITQIGHHLFYGD